MNKDIKEFYELRVTITKSGYDNSGWREQSTYYEYDSSKRIGWGTYEEMKKLSLTDCKMRFVKDYNINLLKFNDLNLITTRLNKDCLNKGCLIKVQTLDGIKTMHCIDINSVKYKLETILKDDSIFEAVYYKENFIGSELYHISNILFDEIMIILKKHLIEDEATEIFTDVYREVSISTGIRNRAYLQLGQYTAKEDIYLIDKYLSDRENYIYPKPIYEALKSLLQYRYRNNYENSIFEFISTEIIKKSNKNFNINKEYLDSYLKRKLSFGIAYIAPKLKRKFGNIENLLSDIDKVISEFHVLHPYKAEIINTMECSINKFSSSNSITDDMLNSICDSLKIHRTLKNINSDITKNEYSHQQTSLEKIREKFYQRYPEYTGYDFISCNSKGGLKLNLHRDSSDVIKLDYLYKFI